MTERESREVEKILLHISDAGALRSSEQGLADLHRSLSQSTYYAVPDDGLRLAV